MPKPEVLEFAKLLMREVRDDAVATCDNLLNPRSRGVMAVRWHKAIEKGIKEFAPMAISDSIDTAIFFF